MNNQLSSDRLKALRESRNLSHDRLKTALCKKYGEDIISSATLKNYEAASKGEYHSKYSAIESITAKNLLMLADFYGVSADYILGISDVATTDKDAAAVCNYTGLSVKSVKVLSWLNNEVFEESMQTINFIIESEWDALLEEYEIDILSELPERSMLPKKYKLCLIDKIASFIFGKYVDNNEELMLFEDGRSFCNDDIELGAYRVKAAEIIEQIFVNNIVDALKAGRLELQQKGRSGNGNG